MPLTISKYQEALRLLTEDATSVEKFVSIKTILEGQNPKVDDILEKCTNSLSKIENLAKGDVISLAVDVLPGKSEEEKRRKKAIILFIKNFKLLKSEVERVKGELTKNNAGQTNAFIKIFALAKGPAGIITALALVIAFGLIAFGNFSKKPNPQLPQATPTPKQTIEGINYNGKQLPLTQLRIGTGSDCDSPHYHAKNEVSAQATDGSQIKDPGGCGFGKLKDTPTLQIQI